jgi:hypothetical protein
MTSLRPIPTAVRSDGRARSTPGQTSGRWAGALFLTLTAACSWSDPPCVADAGPLVGDVACEEVDAAFAYGERLAARPLTDPQRRSLLAAMSTADPTALRERLAAAQAWTTRAASLDAWEAAELRSREVWANEQGQGAFGGEGWLRVRDVFSDAAAVWGQDPATGRAFTEMDIEGWIRLASLCREVQGGSVLRISIADRLEVYSVVRERFLAGDDAEQRAMLAVGPYWSQVRNVWKVSSAERQQAWIKEAPLPPPMTTESVGYLRAVLAGDVSALVRSVHTKLGPFRLD